MTTTLARRFTTEDLAHWRRHGFVVIPGWLTPDEVAAARAALDALVPGWAQPPYDAPAFGERGFVEFGFPYAADVLNDVTLHPALLEFAMAALQTDVVTLAHSELMLKRAAGRDFGGHDFDQPMHTDHANNSLVVPDPRAIDQLASITYYTDVTVDLGPTYVVGWQDSVGWHDRNFVPREQAGELYAHEAPVAVPAGSIVLYTMGTFHRGSGFRADTGVRASHHVAFQRADVTWGRGCAYAALGGDASFAALLSRLQPVQRSALGFPPPGHRYWTAQTLAAVQARYPDMDLSGYSLSR